MNNQSSNELKYGSNNILKQILIDLFVKRIVKLINPKNDELILDLGCGEGYIIQKLTETNKSIQVIGVDNSQTAIIKAKRRSKQKFLCCDLFKLPKQICKEKYNKIVMLEVLEHLPNYKKALQVISDLDSEYYIFSVPFEPWFSLGNLLSGKDVVRLGTHPEHVNYWNRQSFKQALIPYFGDVKILISFPWLIAICKN